MTTQQPEALRLAELLELAPEDGIEPQTTEDAAAELRRLHTENTALQQGYAAARLEIESLQARIKTMAEEHADELTVAHLDGRMRAAQPAGAQQPVAAYAALMQAASDWICEHVPTGTRGSTAWATKLQDAARALRASHGQAPAQAAPAAVAGPSAPGMQDAIRQYTEAQDALDNREYAGINAEPYDKLLRARNAARRDLEAALAAAPTTQPAPQQEATGVGNSGFDHKTASDFLSGKTVTDEAMRGFVASSRAAHDDRESFRAQLLALRGELKSREAEIALLKQSLLDAEAAPQQEAQEPVMIYHGGCTIDCGEHGHHNVELLRMIPAGSKLYTAPKPSPASQGDALDAARYRYLRDGDWREHEKLESVIRLQLNTLWDETIDAACAAQKGGS